MESSKSDAQVGPAPAKAQKQDSSSGSGPAGLLLAVAGAGAVAVAAWLLSKKAGAADQKKDRRGNAKPVRTKAQEQAAAAAVERAM